MKRIKSLERKLRHNCPTCQATYTLLETHLTQKDLTCQVNCLKLWETLLLKHCQEKVLGSEIVSNSEKDYLLLLSNQSKPKLYYLFHRRHSSWNNSKAKKRRSTERTSFLCFDFREQR